MAKPREIVQLLLNDEQLASLDKSGSLAAAESSKGKQPAKKDNASMGDLWNEEGDDFFGQTVGANEDKGDEDAGTTGTAVQKKKRRGGGTGAPKGRRPGKKTAEPSATPAETADL